MLKRFVSDFLLGYRIITVEEDYLIEVIRILFKFGIPFKIKEGKIYLCRAAYKRAILVLDKEKIKHRSSSLGIRGFFARLLKKKGVVAALFVLCALTFLASNTVLDIRITGLENISDEAVLGELSDNGFWAGKSWFFLDTGRVENDILLSSDVIGWININRRGGVAYVEIREKKEREEPKYTYASIVSKYDCVIEEITVLSGYAMVNVGDTVKKGDVLISGVPGGEGGDFVAAQGRVIGRVNDRIYAYEDRVNLKTEEKYGGFAGFSLKIFEKQINIFKIYGNSTNEYVIIDNEYEYTLFGKRIPLSFICFHKTDYLKSENTLTDEELIFAVREKTSERILSLTEGADLLSLRSDGRFTDNGYILYTDVVFLSDVCDVVPFDVK